MQSAKLKAKNNIYKAVSPIGDDHLRQTSLINRHTPEYSENQTRTVRAKHQGILELVTKVWLQEWLSWLLAAASISGIVIILSKFDKHPVTDWPYSITLGALVSLLATVATIGLAEPAAAGIGQAKWTWYQKPQPMIDFHLIDEASRGPLKAAWLIFRLKGGVLALCGASLAIAVLAVNPFAQQVVRLDTISVETSNAARLPIAQAYDNSNAPGLSGVSLSPDLSMKAAIQRGLLDINANASTFYASPQCLSGNCTWPTYSTLAVCSRCTDISALLTTTTDPKLFMNASLPNGVFLYGNLGMTREGEIAMSVNISNGMTYPTWASLAYAQWSNPVADVITIVLPYAFDNQKEHLQGPYASECILQLCVQNFTSTSVNGVFSETASGSPVYANDTLNTGRGYLLSVSGTNYTIDWNTAKALSQYFADNFNEEIHQENTPSPIDEWSEGSVAQSIFYWTNASTDHLPTRVFDNIASSMTLNMRQVSNLTAAGVSTTLQTIFVVRWAWMTLPFALLLLDGLYLSIIMWATKRSHLEPWKTSSLPTLMHGLADDKSRDFVSGRATLAQMESVAKDLNMKSITQYEAAGAEAKHLGLTLIEGIGKSINMPVSSSSSRLVSVEEHNNIGYAY